MFKWIKFTAGIWGLKSLLTLWIMTTPMQPKLKNKTYCIRFPSIRVLRIFLYKIHSFSLKILITPPSPNKIKCLPVLHSPLSLLFPFWLETKCRSEGHQYVIQYYSLFRMQRNINILYSIILKSYICNEAIVLLFLYIVVIIWFNCILLNYKIIKFYTFSFYYTSAI